MSSASIIRDSSLAPSGADKIAWVWNNMPLLRAVCADFEKDRPLTGLKVALSVHLEAKTACLCRTLAAGGAEVFATGSNPLSTQDDVAAELARLGVHVYATHGCSQEEYDLYIRKVIEPGPDIIVDDGGDIVQMIRTRFPELEKNVIGGCEETTTGIARLRKLERNGALHFPMIAVNDADCKHLFDNRYGTGQSVFDGIDRTTNLIVAGKKVVVAGYGWCGKGVSMRAKGLGARVIVTEVDPVKALEAHMDGFTVMSMDEAAEQGDLFITVTGNCKVITEEHFLKMKNGAILCNAGHFDVEVDTACLNRIAAEQKQMKPNIRGYLLPNGTWIYLLAEGRLVNLAAGDRHPAEIMDMSFAIQALSCSYLAGHRGMLEPRLIPVPREIDNAVASKKLETLGIRIDALTPEQREYIGL